MARETRDIVYPIAFTGFILPVMTILVIDPDKMNGLTLAKYFWFYSTLLLTGVIALGLAFYSMSVASIDITKSIMIGILTVVIIGISRNSNMEMMNAKIFLLVIISFFFFDIFFHHYKKASKAFQFVLLAFALLEVTLYWTITLFQKLKYGYSRHLAETDGEHVRPEIIDDILLFLLSALGIIGILSILPLTGIPSAWFIAGCSGLFVLYFKLNIHTFFKTSISRNHTKTAISGMILLLVAGLLTTVFYRQRKDEINITLLTSGTGLAGILLFIGLIVSALSSGFRARDKHPEKLAITGALIAFTLAGFIDSPTQSLSLSILLVLLISLATSDTPPTRKIPNLVYPNFLLAQLYFEMGLRDKTLEYARQVIMQKTKKESEETLHIKAKMKQLIQQLD